MKNEKPAIKLRNVAILSILAALLAFSFSLSYLSELVYPSSSNQLTANVEVPTSCFTQLSNTVISFGTQLSPSTQYGPQNAVVDTDIIGNANANILVSATNMIIATAPTHNFYITNTIWNPTLQTAFVGNPITSLYPLVGADTGIVVIAGNTVGNSIYFGIEIPNGQAAGSYTQNIYIENNC